MASPPVGEILKQYPFFRDFITGREDERTFGENLREFQDELSRHGVSPKELAALVESISPSKQHETYESFRRNSVSVRKYIMAGNPDKVFKISLVLLLLCKKLSQHVGAFDPKSYGAHARLFLVGLFRLLRESHYPGGKLTILENAFHNIGRGNSNLPVLQAVA